VRRRGKRFGDYVCGDGQALSSMNAGAGSFSILRRGDPGPHRPLGRDGRGARLFSPAMVRNVME
jgi:hypothetical protein